MGERREITDVVFSGDKSQTALAPPQPQPAIGVPQSMPPPDTHANPLDCSSRSQIAPDKNARVDAVWKQMNKGISTEKLHSITKKSTSVVNRASSKPSSKVPSSSWITVLGLGPKKTSSVQPMPVLKPDDRQHSFSDKAKKLAAAALSAVKDTTNMATVSGRGKVELREVRDFAGEAIEVKKLVDTNSKEASERAKASGGGGAASAVDAVLEQIRKKPKLSVLDKTKKDWGEFKEENCLEEELETYKKSGNQYLDKVSFLERADYREFERERDARLASQAKRKSDMREDD